MELAHLVGAIHPSGRNTQYEHNITLTAVAKAAIVTMESTNEGAC